MKDISKLYIQVKFKYDYTYYPAAMYTQILIIIAITLTTLLGVFVVPLPNEQSTSSALLYLSAIIGYMGIMLMLWSYILGTRGVIKPVFKDLTPIISIHKWMGKYATVFIFTHPLFVTLSYGESLLYSFIPNISSNFALHVTYGRIALVTLLVVWISSALLRSKMGYRPWKYLHFLAYLSLPFALLHIPDTGRSFMGALAPKLYFYTILIGFIIFTLLRLRSALNFNKFRYSVLSNREVTPRVYTLHLKSTTAGALMPKPGQFIYLKTSWFSEEHPFSVLANDTETNELYVCYKVYGAFTKQLSKLATGDQLYVNGSFGRFTHELSASTRPTVYLAGGIGITPFLSRLFSESGQREQWLFYANRSLRDAPYLDSLRNHMGEHCVPIISEGSSIEDRGARLAESLQSHLTSPAAYHFYLCGPEGFMKTATVELTKLGVPKNQIFQESFSY